MTRHFGVHRPAIRPKAFVNRTGNQHSGKNLLVEESFALVILAEKILRNTGIGNDTDQRMSEQRFSCGSECCRVFVFLPCAVSNFRPETICLLSVRKDSFGFYFILADKEGKPLGYPVCNF